MADLNFPWEALEATLVNLGGRAALEQLSQVIKRAGSVYEAEAVALAPHEHGYLENTSTVRTRQTGSGVQTVIAFTAIYAARQHELHDVQWGERTLAKPATRFGVPGAKYLERVLRGMDFEGLVGKSFRDILREAAKKRKK